MTVSSLKTPGNTCTECGKPVETGNGYLCSEDCLSNYTRRKYSRPGLIVITTGVILYVLALFAAAATRAGPSHLMVPITQLLFLIGAVMVITGTLLSGKGGREIINLRRLVPGADDTRSVSTGKTVRCTFCRKPYERPEGYLFGDFCSINCKFASDPGKYVQLGLKWLWLPPTRRIAKRSLSPRS